jgi:hypothetical protein
MAIDTDGAPVVLLGGKSWPVPVLAAKQNRLIDPLILSLIPVFAQWQTDKAGALTKLGEKEYDALVEIAFQAIRRAAPDVKRDEFMDLPVTLPELIAAFSVIAQQTGVFARSTPGEAMAGKAPPPPPTGTE